MAAFRGGLGITRSIENRREEVYQKGEKKKGKNDE